jgi:hypothetical protein
MSDAVLVALIGVGGTVVGAVSTILITYIQAAHKAAPPPETPEIISVIGKSFDIRELRILRALFGERRGRILEAYQDKYYGPSLQALVERELVKKIEKRYYMTPKGAEFCRAYLKELFETWQPEARLNRAPQRTE